MHNNIVETRYGICINADHILAAAAAGFDYLEMDMRNMFAMNGKAWLDMASLMQKAGIRAEVVSGILPPDVSITGADASPQAIRQALHRSFEFARLLGAEMMVFDCEAQRILPSGFDPVSAWSRTGDFLRMLQEEAEKYRIDVSLLPLRRSAVDLMHHTSEAAMVAALLHLEHIGIAASSYNMAMEGEGLAQLQQTGSLLWHVRTGGVLGNRLPRRDDGEDYAALMETLAGMQYRGRISCEGNWSNFQADAAEALFCLKAANRRI